MKFLFTKKMDEFGSLLIRWGTGEPVSHVAVCFDDKLVFESKANGTQINSYESVLRDDTIVFALEPAVELTYLDENAIYDELVKSCHDRPYDFRGNIYIAWRCILKKLFNKPFPSKNPWNDPFALNCVEVGVAAVRFLEAQDRVDLLQKNVDSDMVTPYEIYDLLKQSGRMKEVDVGGLKSGT